MKLWSWSTAPVFFLSSTCEQITENHLSLFQVSLMTDSFGNQAAESDAPMQFLETENNNIAI